MPNSKENRAWAHRQERKALIKSLQKHKGNLKKTARAIRMSYSTLNYKVRVLDLKDIVVELRRARREGVRPRFKTRVKLVEVPISRLRTFVSVLEAE